MESKLNYKTIEAYVKAYSTRLSEELFAERESVSGDEILNLPVRQVGLFMLNTMYKSWALEADKLKSPYFNYDNESVNTALQKLMNVLSKNILVSRSHFEPILNEAVNNTLLLLISPYSYYKYLLEKEDTNYDVLKAMEKFVSINNGVLAKVIAKLDKSPDLIKQTDDLLNEVFSSLDETPQNNDEFLQKFSELQPLKESDFYLTNDEKPSPQIQTYENEEENEAENTLHTNFASGSYETIADNLQRSQQQQVSTLKSMLSINQKFMFINDLFNDSQEDFTKVLDFLEDCDTKEAAISFIHNNYLKNNIWKENSPQVKDFLALLDKKFSKK